MASASTVLCFLGLILVPSGHAYKLLFVSADIGSHLIYVSETAALFKQKGHDVTLMVGTNVNIPDSIVRLNLNIIRFHNPLLPLDQMEAFKQIMYDMAFNPSLASQVKIHDLQSGVQTQVGEYMLSDVKAQAAVEAGNYDYVIADPAITVSLFIPYKLGLPYGVITVDCLSHIRRIPEMPSFVPITLTSFSDQMTFKERFTNFWFLVLLLSFDIGGQDLSRKFVPDKPVVGFIDLFANASLCLQLRESTIDFTRPEMPDVVSMATVMGRPSGPLPSDLQLYMDQASHGVILLSFGSVVSDMPDFVLQKLLDGLRDLPQKVIFKHKGGLANVPHNVKVMSWMPQNDLLGHPNMKLFITHCGMSSLIEAIYHGIPMLGVPYFIDQHNNAALVRSKKLGETMAINDFTAAEMTEKITRILTADVYSKTAKKRSAIYRDVKASGKRDPVYWVEHVIKYGGQHLRAHAYNMPLYQYFMLDIIAVSLILFVAVTLGVLATCRCAIRCICCRGDKKAKSE